MTAALGLIAAARGKRVNLCEVGAGPSAFRTLLGGSPSPGLTVTPIDPESAKRGYLERQFRSGALAALLGRSRMFQLLTAASPGLAELLTIGNVWELARLDGHQRRDP